MNSSFVENVAAVLGAVGIDSLVTAVGEAKSDALSISPVEGLPEVISRAFVMAPSMTPVVAASAVTIVGEGLIRTVAALGASFFMPAVINIFAPMAPPPKTKFKGSVTIFAISRHTNSVALPGV